MISLEEAKEQILASIKPLDSEQVPLSDALGRYSAADVTALIDLPRFDNSAMDGYAVRSDDLKTASDSNPVDLQVIGRISAGEPFSGVLSPGTCLRLFTGSVLPNGADAVVMQEDVWAENGSARFIESIRPLENVRLSGEDIRRGTMLFEAGVPINPARIALLAATGHPTAAVRKLPRVGLLATGDELTEPGEPLAPGKIYESNRAMLSGLLNSIGIRATILPLVGDSLQHTEAALTTAFANHDVMITTGGVSVGEFDFVKEAFTRSGGTIDHWKVAIRPGKPFVFGRLRGKFLFGLPGNPISALVTYLVLVRPALLAMLGALDRELPRVTGVLEAAIANPGDRRHFVRCRWQGGKVQVPGRQASHMIGALSGANCLVDLPPASRLEIGTEVTAHLWEMPGG